MNHQVIIRSINGVAFNQRVDGAILCHVSPTNADAFKAELISIVDAINRWQISIVEAQRSAMAQRMQLPPHPARVLETQLEQLRLQAQVTDRLKQAPPDPLTVPALVDPNEIAARAQTLVAEGPIMVSEDLGPPPETL